MSPFPVHCPSCDHCNPVGSNFCNHCGAPVHFEACSHCEAINHRDAHRCHNCGSPLSRSLEFLSIPATVVAGIESSSRGRTASDQDAPACEPRAHANDAIIDEGSASMSIGAEQMARTDETSAPPRQLAEKDFDVHGGHADSQTTRRRSPRVALAVVMVVALAILAYVAYENSAQFRQAIEAITPTLDPSSTAHSTSSSQTIPPNAPMTGPHEATPLIQDSAGRSREPTVDASGDAESQPDNIASEPPPPPQGAGDSKPSTSGARAAHLPQAAKTVRKSMEKSSASKSKQSGSSRKPASRELSDARARAKATSPTPAPPTAVR